MTERRCGQDFAGELKALGDAFREARQQEELTQEDLAERSGVSSSLIRRIEDGAVDPGYEGMILLAKGIGTPLTPIFNRAQRLAQRKE